MPVAGRVAVSGSGYATPRLITDSGVLPRRCHISFPCRSIPPLHLHCGRRRHAAIRAAAKSDHYSTLNVARSATLQEIKSSYRSLARKYHPDMNKSSGAEEKFKEISAAYEVLSDSRKRSIYDQFGDPGLQGEYGSAGAGPGMVDPFEMFDAIFGESNGIFGGLAGFGNGAFNVRGGNNSLDVRYNLELDFEESIFGGKKVIEVTRFETCAYCNGTGAKSSNCIKSCSECGGRGGVTKSQKTPFGVVSQVTICSNCQGEGKVIIDSCKQCNGHGRVQSKQSVDIDIPPGVSSGVTMRIQGGGSVDGKRGIVGDLYISFRVKEKDGIRRDGLNLVSIINIHYTEAILGTVIKVETTEGLKDLMVPAGTQPGEVLRLPSIGVPDINRPSVRGEHHFVVTIEIPKHISSEERIHVEKLTSLNPERTFTYGRSDGSNQNASTLRSSKRSLWNSIKKRFWKSDSGSRFASTSLEMSVPLPVLRQKMPVFVLATTLAFFLTCLYVLLTRTKSTKILEEKN